MIDLKKKIISWGQYVALEIYQEIYYFDFDFSLQELFIKLAYLAF